MADFWYGVVVGAGAVVSVLGVALLILNNASID